MENNKKKPTTTVFVSLDKLKVNDETKNVNQSETIEKLTNANKDPTNCTNGCNTNQKNKVINKDNGDSKNIINLSDNSTNRQNSQLSTEIKNSIGQTDLGNKINKSSPKTTNDEPKANLEKDALDTSKNYIKNSSPKTTIDETKVDLVKDDLNIGKKVDTDVNRDGEPSRENKKQTG